MFLSHEIKFGGNREHTEKKTCVHARGMSKNWTGLGLTVEKITPRVAQIAGVKAHHAAEGHKVVCAPKLSTSPSANPIIKCMHQIGDVVFRPGTNLSREMGRKGGCGA